MRPNGGWVCNGAQRTASAQEGDVSAETSAGRGYDEQTVNPHADAAPDGQRRAAVSHVGYGGLLSPDLDFIGRTTARCGEEIGKGVR